MDSGTGRNFVWHFNYDQTIDAGFGTYGKVILPSTVTGTASSATLQDNGNIVVNYPTSVVTLNRTGAIISVVPTGNTINAPTGLTAPLLIINSLLQNAVNLSFIDNATNETGFAIERATLPGGAYSVQTILPDSNGSGLAVTYVDTTTTAGAPGRYRFRPRLRGAG